MKSTFKILLSATFVLVVATVSFGQSGTTKPKNLQSMAKNSPMIYGTIMANDIKKSIKLDDDEYEMVKNSYNEYNLGINELKSKGSDNFVADRDELEKKRDDEILKTLSSEDKKEAYKKYLKTKKRNN